VAVGIGINLGFFSVAYAVLRQGLPVPNPDQLTLYSTRRAGATNVSGPVFEALRKFGLQTQLLAWARTPLKMRSAERLEEVSGALLSGNGFAMLQIRPAAGSFFDASDDVPGRKGAYPAVLAYRYWKARYAGDVNVIGHAIVINGAPAYIAAVLPPGFDGLTPPYSPQVILPLSFDPVIHAGERWMAAPNYQWLTVFGRLPNGIALDSVRANLQTIDANLRAAADPKGEYLPDPQHGPALVAQSGRLGKSQLESEYRRPLLALEGMGLALFTLCCCNLVLLFVGRAATLSRETAIKTALGAPSGRLLTSAAVEAAALAACGAVLAIPAAEGFAHLLGLWLMSSFGRPATQLPGAALNALFAVAALGLAVASCVAAALLGSLWQNTGKPGAALGTGRPTGRLRSNPWIISVEIAFAVILIAAASVGALGFYKLAHKASGFSTSGTIIARLDVRDSQENSPEPSGSEAGVRMGRVIAAIQRAPGIAAVSTLSTPPLMGAASTRRITARLGDGGIRTENVWPEIVSAGYFAAMGTRITRGRAFSDSDIGAASVCVLGTRTARAFFEEGDPIGKFLFTSEAEAKQEGGGQPACRVIGVAEDAHFKTLTDSPDKMVYQLGMRRAPGAVTLAVHASSTGLAVQAVNSALREAAPGSLPPGISGVDELIANDIRRERALMLLSGVSAAIVAVILGGGIFGAVTLAASRRRRDLAVRVALGATTPAICQALVREFLLPVVTGFVVGSAGFLYAMRWLTALFATSAGTGIGAFGVATLFLFIISIAGVSIPLGRVVSAPSTMNLLNE